MPPARASKQRQYRQSPQYQKYLHRRKGSFAHHWSVLKSGARRRGKVVGISFETFQAIVQRPCRYCGETADPIHGIDRIDNAVGYCHGNCAPSCARCNYMKHTHAEPAFVAHVAQIVRRHLVPPSTPERETATPSSTGFTKYVARALRKGLSFSLTRAVFDTVRRRPCHYCGGVKSMGLDRVDNARGYTTDNVVPACTTCNLMKKNMPAEDLVRACWAIVTKAAEEGVARRSLSRNCRGNAVLSSRNATKDCP
jgi:hypothetical protein